MKNVIVYNQINTDYHGGQRYADEELQNYLKCQIDNNLRLGWDKDDIIIGTNFDFEYNGIKNYELEDVCEYSGFNNFWYGALELMDRGILNDDFWLHDQDTWALQKFEFPKFSGEVAGCEYVGTKEWNCGSIYFKKSSKPILEYIVDVMRNNEASEVSSDEQWISFLRHSENSEIKDFFRSINTRYNVGMTHLEHRIAKAIEPICVLSVKPPDTKCFDLVKHIFSDEQMDILYKHNLLEES